MDLAEMWSLVPPCVFVCTWMIMCVCLDVYEWLLGGVYCISSLLVHYSSSEAGNLEHSLTVGSVTIHLPAISAKLSSCPFTTKYSLPSFMSLLPSVSLVTRQWTALCPAKAALFCLCGLFYPCANRHGRVPELHPIFHAQLSFVWHTAPDKNPNSRASLILKSNSGVERAFNHPLSVLQWLPFNVPGSMLLITGPRAEALPWKNPHPLTSVSHASISIDISDAARRQPRIECCWEMSVKCHSSFSAGISWSLMWPWVFRDSCEDTLWHYWVSLSLNGHWIFNSLFFFRKLGLLFFFLHKAALLLMS